MSEFDNPSKKLVEFRETVPFIILPGLPVRLSNKLGGLYSDIDTELSIYAAYYAADWSVPIHINDALKQDLVKKNNLIIYGLMNEKPWLTVAEIINKHINRSSIWDGHGHIVNEIIKYAHIDFRRFLPKR